MEDDTTSYTLKRYTKTQLFRISMKPFAAAFSLLALASSVCGALQQVTGFGTNPTNVQMYISVPSKVATNPAIIVAVSI